MATPWPAPGSYRPHDVARVVFITMVAVASLLDELTGWKGWYGAMFIPALVVLRHELGDILARWQLHRAVARLARYNGERR